MKEKLSNSTTKETFMLLFMSEKLVHTDLKEKIQKKKKAIEKWSDCRGGKIMYVEKP